MKIDKHISDLLYRYDCVIVPELGGFVCNYAPARIHPVQNSFTPPSKYIVFNSNLRNNDGLLANHISQEEKKTFIEANGIISRFVADTGSQLSSGKRVSIEQVGTLFLDVERNLQFEPDDASNFLLDSFGLNTFHSPAIRREGISQRIEKEFKDRVIPKEKAPVQKRGINVRRMVTLAIALPLLAFISWASLGTDFLKTGKLSSLNPFAVKETPLYKPSSTSVPVITASDLTGDHATVFTDNTPVTIKVSDNSSRSIVVSLTDENVTRPDSTSVKPIYGTTSATHGNFYIIGGCFEVYTNATNFAAALKAKGYGDAAILDQKLGRLSPVAYSGYTSMQDAVAALAKIHAEDPNAWILSW